MSAKVSISSEYDYFSMGFVRNDSKLFNEKNTEIGVSANVSLDTQKLIYPIELRNDPSFKELEKKNRNSYSLGLNFSQILSMNIQDSISLDVIQQQDLLSTPFQRVYFADIDDTFKENFHLADDIEHLPDSRFKTSIGDRTNFYINKTFVLRTYFTIILMTGVLSQTQQALKSQRIKDKFALYLFYRVYNQTSADYFNTYNTVLSADELFTSSFDLSQYDAHQYGLGINYTDIFTKLHIVKFGLKSADLKYNYCKRNTGLSSSIITAGVKLVQD